MYGFTCHQKDEDIPQCVLCMKTLANSYLKPFQLTQHLNNTQKEQDSKSIEDLKSKEGCLKMCQAGYTKQNFPLLRHPMW